LVEPTGYFPIELLGEVKGGLFKEICQKLPDKPSKEDLPTIVLKAYAKMKGKAEKRKRQKGKGNFRWRPQIGDQVLVKSKPVSDASKGITGKFQRLYEGPFVIKEVVNVYLYKLQSKSGNSKGLFHISHLKPYVTPDERV
jgi:hypothetical protein